MNEHERRALHLLGSAWRGSWADFDGRTLRDQLDTIAGGFESDLEVEQWAKGNDICAKCACWMRYCDGHGEASP